MGIVLSSRIRADDGNVLKATVSTSAAVSAAKVVLGPPSSAEDADDDMVVTKAALKDEKTTCDPTVCPSFQRAKTHTSRLFPKDADRLLAGKRQYRFLAADLAATVRAVAVAEAREVAVLALIFCAFGLGMLPAAP